MGSERIDYEQGELALRRRHRVGGSDAPPPALSAGIADLDSLSSLLFDPAAAVSQLEPTAVSGAEPGAASGRSPGVGESVEELLGRVTAPAAPGPPAPQPVAEPAVAVEGMPPVVSPLMGGPAGTADLPADTPVARRHGRPGGRRLGRAAGRGRRRPVARVLAFVAATVAVGVVVLAVIVAGYETARAPLRSNARLRALAVRTGLPAAGAEGAVAALERLLGSVAGRVRAVPPARHVRARSRAARRRPRPHPARVASPHIGAAVRSATPLPATAAVRTASATSAGSGPSRPAASPSAPVASSETQAARPAPAASGPPSGSSGSGLVGTAGSCVAGCQ